MDGSWKALDDRILLTVKHTAGLSEGTRIEIEEDTYWVTKIIDAHTVELMPEPRLGGEEKPQCSTWNVAWVLLLLMLITYLIRF